jgi:hypothetical protein
MLSAGFSFAQAKRLLGPQRSDSALHDSAHYEVALIAAAGRGARHFTHKRGLKRNIRWMP